MLLRNIILIYEADQAKGGLGVFLPDERFQAKLDLLTHLIENQILEKSTRNIVKMGKELLKDPDFASIST
jgi:hypothetical protein